MLSEAQRFWDAIVGKVRKTAQEESKNAFRCERYEVTTAPDGMKIGVTLPLGTREIFLPYSREVADATVGTPVLVVWWGSMSNAKVYYYADGYSGTPLAAYPVGSIYMSVNSTSPAVLFGGTWVQIEDTFLLAAGTTYTAGDTGGEATHTLTDSELPIESGSFSARGWSNSGSFLFGESGIVSRTAGTGTYNNVTDGGSAVTPWEETISFGGGNAHNNMPPYLVVYAWYRTA